MSLRVVLAMSGELEPEKPPRILDSEILVRIAVPEEFVGAAQREFALRDGIITDMKMQGQSRVIYGRLPVRGYDTLVEMISSFTRGAGMVAKREPQNGATPISAHIVRRPSGESTHTARRR